MLLLEVTAELGLHLGQDWVVLIDFVLAQLDSEEILLHREILSLASTDYKLSSVDIRCVGASWNRKNGSSHLHFNILQIMQLDNPQIIQNRVVLHRIVSASENSDQAQPREIA